MKIQLASDLHLEFLARSFPGETIIRPAHQADVLVLAGDIHISSNAIQLFQNWPVPVLYVVGNHEYYGGCVEDVQEQLRNAARGTSITILERAGIDFGGVRFFGATLWTDYCLHENRTQRQLQEHAALRLNDHRRIRMRTGELFSPAMSLAEHVVSKTWLRNELSVPYDGKTVVVSHHGPHPLSVHPRYAGDALNAAFVSDLSDILPMADLWLHGHVHDSFDYTVGRCRVVANPCGYARNANVCSKTVALEFENHAFQYACVIQV